MLTQEEFILYYEKNNRVPSPSAYSGNKPLNNKQLITKYKDYVKKCSRFETRMNSIINDDDSPYVSSYIKNQRSAKIEARELDPNATIFFSKLNNNEITIVKNMMNMGQEFSIIDPAHIFSCGGWPKMSNVVENILMLPRCVHSLIDTRMNPLTETHESISKTEWEAFWIRFIGIDRWNFLLKLSIEK